MEYLQEIRKALSGALKNSSNIKEYRILGISKSSTKFMESIDRLRVWESQETVEKPRGSPPGFLWNLKRERDILKEKDGQWHDQSTHAFVLWFTERGLFKLEIVWCPSMDKRCTAWRSRKPRKSFAIRTRSKCYSFVLKSKLLDKFQDFWFIFWDWDMFYIGILPCKFSDTLISGSSRSDWKFKGIIFNESYRVEGNVCQ